MFKKILILFKLPHPFWHIPKIIVSMTGVRYDSDGTGHVTYHEFYCKKCRKEWRVDIESGKVSQIYPANP